MKRLRNGLPALAAFGILTLLGCASPYLMGTNPAGEKVYVGPGSIAGTDAYQAYLLSKREEVDKLYYLFKRFTENHDLYYHYDGGRYSWIEAYRGVMWVLRHRYKGENAREFIRRQVLLDAKPGRPNLIEFPDGSRQIAYYVLMNELDLLEASLAKEQSQPK